MTTHVSEPGGRGEFRRPATGRAARWLLPVLALFVLAGCGTQFLYNRLDTLLYYYFATQVTLQPQQSQSLRSDLRDFLAWHRSAELPRYAALAEGLARDAARPLGRERIDRARLEVEQLWRDAVDRAAPPAARWLASLSPTQRDELFLSFAEDDQDFREEYCEAGPHKRQREREKSFISSTEDWVGRLTPAQRELVRTRLATLQPTGCGFVESRLQLRQDLRTLIDSRSASPDYAAALARLLTQPEERWSREYRQGFDANRDIVVQLIADLDASFTPAQRERLTTKLQEYARDFRALAAAGAVATTARTTAR